MQIRHNTKGKKGEFFIDDNGQRLGELFYFNSAPGQITIYHTQVGDKLRGQGKGNDLVEAAVRYAREHDQKIVATCPYAIKVLDRTPAFQDVLV